MHDREYDELLQRALEKEDGNLTREELLKYGAGLGAGLALFSGLAGTAFARSGGSPKPPVSGASVAFNELVAEAKREKRLNVIALPRDWANYGEMLDTFKKRYGLRLQEASPNASSAEELEAVKALKGQSRGPDVLDVGPAFAIQGKKEGLFQPYKNRQWGTVPAFMKDAQGHWVGDYWGVIAFGVNGKVVGNVPKTWNDLLKPEYKGQVALNGDPRQSGSAFAGVYSASLANGGSLSDIRPGVDFFKRIKDAGNFILVDATPSTVASGQTPITVDWDYLQIGYGKEFAGLNWQVQVPSTGVFGNYYCQAISKFAPHPWASRLWQEFIYSTAGQLIWLKGFSHPARFADLAQKGLIPAALRSKLPPAAAYEKVRFPNATQTEKAKAVLAAEWGPKVAGA